MKAAYPGTPGKEAAIQTEVSKTTGAIAPIMLCKCGRTPMLVSLGYDLVRVACPCGMNGRNARTQARAINNWNHSVVDMLLEHHR
jgi:hypothetical protein